MKINVFIIRSGRATDHDLEKAIDSVKPFADQITQLKDLHEFKHDDSFQWNFFIYDNERVQKALAKAMEIYRYRIEMDGFSFFKRVGSMQRMFVAPRMFKERIDINPNTLLPEGDNLNIERTLDGFIIEDM